MANGGDLGAVAIEDFLELAARVRPAMRENDRISAPAIRARHAVVALVAIELQDAVEPLEELLGDFAAAIRGAK